MKIHMAMPSCVGTSEDKFFLGGWGGTVQLELPWYLTELVKNLPAVQGTPVRSLGWEVPLEEGIGYLLQYSWAFFVVQMVKNLSAMQKTPGSIPGLGRSPGGGRGNPRQCSCLENPHGQRSLAGCSPWGRRVRHDRATKHSRAAQPAGSSSPGRGSNPRLLQ